MENNFIEDVGNLESSNNYSYLLNFWHVSKLNKELEYIKRNGLHPNLSSKILGNMNYVEVDEGNSIQTSFYVSFRIFLKFFFENAEAFKTRDSEEWKITFKEDIPHTENLNFLYLKYNEHNLNSRNGIIRKPTHRYGVKKSDSYLICLENKDQLHAKVLLDKFKEFTQNANAEVDKSISTELKEITAKIANQLGIRETPKPPKVRFEAPRPVTPEPIRVDPVLSLLPTYHQLKDQIRMFDPRIKFSYILNFAKSNSSSPQIQSILDNENNYNAFLNATNNMSL